MIFIKIQYVQIRGISINHNSHCHHIINHYIDHKLYHKGLIG